MPDEVYLAEFDGEWGIYPITADHPLDAFSWFPNQEAAEEWLETNGYQEDKLLPGYYGRKSNA